MEVIKRGRLEITSAEVTTTTTTIVPATTTSVIAAIVIIVIIVNRIGKQHPTEQSSTHT
jgi:hypothetical protein